MTVFTFALGFILAASPAAEVYGDLRVGDRYVADAAIELKCGTEVVKSKTDQAGSFRISARSMGKCTIAVTHEGQSPSVEVVLFEKPARYRLLLEKKDDNWILRRV